MHYSQIYHNNFVNVKVVLKGFKHAEPKSGSIFPAISVPVLDLVIPF
mgnify:CR=1 FL=1